MAFSADAVANGLLDRAERDGYELTHLQLQKLVFFAHAWHLGSTNEPLISEPVQAWKLGPVFQSLWVEFTHYGDNPISSRAVDFSWDSKTGKLTRTPPSLKAEAGSAGLDLQTAETLTDWVWRRYRGLGAFELVRLTHAQGEPWTIIKERYPGELPRGLHIPNPLIRDCYRKRVEKEINKGQT